MPRVFPESLPYRLGNCGAPLSLARIPSAHIIFAHEFRRGRERSGAGDGSTPCGGMVLMCVRNADGSYTIMAQIDFQVPFLVESSHRLQSQRSAVMDISFDILPIHLRARVSVSAADQWREGRAGIYVFCEDMTRAQIALPWPTICFKSRRDLRRT